MMRRVPAVMAAYFVGCFAAAFALGIAYFLAGLAKGLVLASPEGFLDMVFLGGTYIAVYALLPAALAIMVAERMGVSSVLYYAAAGGVSGVVAYNVYQITHAWGAAPSRHLELFNQVAGAAMPVVLAFSIPGVIGGAAYWVATGRHAGRAGE